MELFSEIYGLYYRLVGELLEKSPVDRSDIQKLIQKKGFAETALQLTPKLTGKDRWPLFREKDGCYFSVLHHKPETPITLLELRWLKAILCDPRARLFLDDLEYSKLKEKLASVKPLFRQKDFRYFDQYADGDNYQDEEYRRNFRLIQAAAAERQALKISYYAKPYQEYPKICSGNFLPLRLEYSEKDDKFRLHTLCLKENQKRDHIVINLARICSLERIADKTIKAVKEDEWPLKKRCKEPVVLLVSKERNALERLMMEFSSFEKKSEFDDEKELCQVSIWYQTDDETEVLIRILGFGPTVRVISPDRFIQMIAKRMERQKSLLTYLSNSSRTFKVGDE